MKVLILSIDLNAQVTNQKSCWVQICIFLLKEKQVHRKADWKNSCLSDPDISILELNSLLNLQENVPAISLPLILGSLQLLFPVPAAPSKSPRICSLILPQVR